MVSEIAVGNFTDETTIPGYPVEFFPGKHGDRLAYEDVNVDEGLDLFFLPRDAMRKRCSSHRLVSVTLSVTFVYCTEAARDIIIHQTFSQLASPIILVFF